MIHKVYSGDVHDGEPVKGAGSVVKLHPYRVKLATGKYEVILADSEKAAKDYIASHVETAKAVAAANAAS